MRRNFPWSPITLVHLPDDDEPEPSMDQPMNLRSPHRPIRVGVILVNSKTEILDVAPVDIFSALSKEFLHNYPAHMISDARKEQALECEFHWVTETGRPGRLTAGAVVQATHSFITCPPLDIALMGAHDSTYALSRAEIDFVKKTHDGCLAFLFVCGGFQAALQSGLLEDKTATAPRPMIEWLRRNNSEVDWVTRRWARDGKVWTSGALLNGIDMTKAFVEEIWGGPGTLADFSLRSGGYPDRDVNYADVQGEL
ncbi:uncharacterized protein LTR77_004004 [Saxophila tyrrhenica]|uniref:DJ-1/PfpI domain-containing protein n=1 Tax=Saxophila tyrrhenica TaxID=1690608 RepID=A0AAV9PF62_9PEZI|nr:hypothetical protein LTR77_004004 [Saxophila tyrrhenica]